MCWESLLWARTAVLSRGFNLMLNNGRKEVLVPLFDMLDHSPSARYVLHWIILISFCIVVGAIVGVFFRGQKLEYEIQILSFKSSLLRSVLIFTQTSGRVSHFCCWVLGPVWLGSQMRHKVLFILPVMMASQLLLKFVTIMARRYC